MANSQQPTPPSPMLQPQSVGTKSTWGNTRHANEVRFLLLSECPPPVTDTGSRASHRNYKVWNNYQTERRKSHTDLISPTHPLLPIATACLSYSEEDSPLALPSRSCTASSPQMVAQYGDRITTMTTGEVMDTDPLQWSTLNSLHPTCTSPALQRVSHSRGDKIYLRGVRPMRHANEVRPLLLCECPPPVTDRGSTEVFACH